jgi:hypothetical protein
MRPTPTITAVLVLVLFSFCFDQSRAQDPGVADTVRLASISGQIQNKEAVPVFLFNDEELTSVVIPLLLDGYSGWLRYDSVSFVDSRLVDPAVLDNRESYVFGTDRYTVDSLLLSFSLSSGDNLPVGSGKLCDIWFTLHFGGQVGVDSLSQSPKGGLLLIDSNQDSFCPQFTSGLIDIACDYLVGDVTADGSVNFGDVVQHQKTYYYCFPWWDYPVLDRPGRFDLNCDRRTDFRDLIRLCHYTWEIGPPPCTCGTVNAPLYYDPGLPDTIWIEPETLIVGIPSPICFGLINDEPLLAIGFSMAINGTASLDRDDDFYDIWNDRVEQTFDYHIFRESSYDIDTDTFWVYCFDMENSLQAGRDTICCPYFLPLSAGTCTFSLVPRINESEFMLVTEDYTAILPALYSGEIVVLAYLPGDANHDGTINLTDAIFMLKYLLKGDPAPDPLESGDVTCDDLVNLSDVIYLLNYLFRGGPPLCEP